MATAPFQPWRTKATDVGGTERLLEAAARSGTGHFAYISIVGIEGVSLAYYRHKLAAESLVESSQVPWSILRATQFHTLIESYLRGFSAVPGLIAIPFHWQFQPVDPSEVASRLVKAVTPPAAGRLPDFGGPQVRTFKSIAESWIAVRRSSRRLVNLPLPGSFSQQVAEGRLLAPQHPDGLISSGEVPGAGIWWCRHPRRVKAAGQSRPKVQICELWYEKIGEAGLNFFPAGVRRLKEIPGKQR